MRSKFASNSVHIGRFVQPDMALGVTLAALISYWTIQQLPFRKQASCPVFRVFNESQILGC
jgi:hypothetical protein